MELQEQCADCTLLPRKNLLPQQEAMTGRRTTEPAWHKPQKLILHHFNKAKEPVIFLKGTALSSHFRPKQVNHLHENCNTW